MEYVINFMNASLDPVEWARRREDQGWDVLSVADHFFTPGHPFPHVWVAAAAMATATERPKITTAFVNNLFRSPVEVAQAGLSMQQLAGGRFELGLGAGWAKPEVEGAGMDYLEPRDRAGAYIESVQIVRALLHTGVCDFSGDYYDISVDAIAPVSNTPPLLVGSVGGPRTVRHVTPHCDRVEVKAMSTATRNGVLDMAAMAAVTDDDLYELIDRVRSVDAEIPISMFMFCNAGDDELTASMESTMGNGLFSRFTGAPEKVVEGMAWLEELGISRCQISPVDDRSLDRLAHCSTAEAHVRSSRLRAMTHPR